MHTINLNSSCVADIQTRVISGSRLPLNLFALAVVTHPSDFALAVVTHSNDFAIHTIKLTLFGLSHIQTGVAFFCRQSLKISEIAVYQSEPSSDSELGVDQSPGGSEP